MLLCKNRRLFTVAGDNSHVLTPIPMHLIPIPIPFPSHVWSYSHSHGNPMGPMGSQSSPFPCTPLPGRKPATDICHNIGRPNCMHTWELPVASCRLIDAPRAASNGRVILIFASRATCDVTGVGTPSEHCVAKCTRRHGRPHIAANGVSWPSWKNRWKIKKRKHAKRA